MGSAKGSTVKDATQTSAPPAWAQPLLQQGANAAMNLYNQGAGYNVYRGPTVADFSQQKVDALNKIMQMTGGGAPVSNAAMTGSANPQISQIQQMIAQQQAQQQAARAQAAAAAAAAQQRPAATQQQQTYGTYAPNSPGRMGSNR